MLPREVFYYRLTIIWVGKDLPDHKVWPLLNSLFALHWTPSFQTEPTTSGIKPAADNIKLTWKVSFKEAFGPVALWAVIPLGDTSSQRFNMPALAMEYLPWIRAALLPCARLEPLPLCLANSQHQHQAGKAQPLFCKTFDISQKISKWFQRWFQMQLLQREKVNRVGWGSFWLAERHHSGDDNHQPFFKVLSVLFHYKVTLWSLLFCRKEAGHKSRELP